jgi:hypothetical protein
MDINHGFKSTEGVEIHLWNDSTLNHFSFVLRDGWNFFPLPGVVPFCPDWNLNKIADTIRSQILTFSQFAKLIMKLSFYI